MQIKDNKFRLVVNTNNIKQKDLVDKLDEISERFDTNKIYKERICKFMKYGIQGNVMVSTVKKIVYAINEITGKNYSPFDIQGNIDIEI